MAFRDPMSLANELLSALNPYSVAERLLEEIQPKVSAEEREQVRESLADHFRDVLIRVMTSQMTREQFEEYKEAYKLGLMGEDDAMQMRVAAITSQMPGLLAAVSAAFRTEYETLKAVLRD